MKKNLLTMITFALVLVNLVLTAVIAITIIPETKNANALIAKVCSAIDLELQSEEGDEASSIPIDKISVYEIKDGDNGMTISLKKGEDGKDHFAMIVVSLSINQDSKVYKKYYDSLSEKDSLLKTEINNIVGQYTIDEIKGDQQAVQDAIKKRFQKMFGDDFIVSVGFASATYQ